MNENRTDAFWTTLPYIGLLGGFPTSYAKSTTLLTVLRFDSGNVNERSKERTGVVSTSLFCLCSWLDWVTIVLSWWAYLLFDRMSESIGGVNGSQNMPVDTCFRYIYSCEWDWNVLLGFFVDFAGQIWIAILITQIAVQFEISYPKRISNVCCKHS